MFSRISKLVMDKKSLVPKGFRINDLGYNVKEVQLYIKHDLKIERVNIIIKHEYNKTNNKTNKIISV